MQRGSKPSSKDEKAIDLTGDGGILKTVLKEGSGEPIPHNSLAKVHYRGTLEDGTVFDSSRTRGQPFRFTVGARQVILGWDKGVATMKKGEVCILKCAPDYAYGNRQTGPIPPNSTLTFEVELLDWSEDGIGGPVPEGIRQLLGLVAFGVLAFILIRYMFSDRLALPKSF